MILSKYKNTTYEYKRDLVYRTPWVQEWLDTTKFPHDDSCYKVVFETYWANWRDDEILFSL